MAWSYAELDTVLKSTVLPLNPLSMTWRGDLSRPIKSVLSPSPRAERGPGGEVIPYCKTEQMFVY